MGISDLLGLFSEHKLWGMDSLRVVEGSLSSLGTKVAYPRAGSTFEILYSEKFSSKKLYDHLYSKEAAPLYSCCFPHILPTRSPAGNLQLFFSKFKPPISQLVAPPGFFTKLFNTPLPDDPKQAKKRLLHPVGPPPFSELQDIQKQIGASLKKTMDQLSAPKTGLEGLWYPHRMREKFPQMPHSWNYGHADETYFKRTDNFKFEIVQGVKPSEAIHAFLKGPTVADCGNAVTVSCYKAILDVVGEEKFDLYFTHHKQALKITQDPLEEGPPLADFCKFSKQAIEMREGTAGYRPLEVGDLCSFKGVCWYPYKHPDGFGQAWNVIYIGVNEQGEQIFAGHGLSKPLTENELTKLLIKEYNLERTEGDRLFLQLFNIQDIFQETQKRAYYTLPERYENSPEYFLYGFYTSHTTRISAKLVWKLKNSTNLPHLRRELEIRNILRIFTLKSGQHVIYH